MQPFVRRALRLKPPFVRFFFTLLAAFFITSGHATFAQVKKNLTYTLPEGSRYTVTQDDRFPYKTNADGTVTARVLVTFRILGPPPAECYSRAEEPDELLTPEGGILGSDLGFIALSRDFKRGELDDGTGTIVASPQMLRANGAINLDEKTLTAKSELFNRIRELASRDAQNKLRQKAVGSTPEADRSSSIADTNAAFAYGDWLENARAARSLAWHGTANLDLKDERPALNSVGGKVLKLLRDPQSIGIADARFAPDLSDTSFQRYGRWTFEAYTISSNAVPELTTLFGVRVQWALEATFDPKKPPRFPLFAGVRATTQKPSPDATQPGTVSGSGNAAAGNGDAGTDSLISMVTTSPFAGLGNQPGVDLVAGYSILNDGTPPFVGLNLHKGNNRLKRGLFDQSRLGVLLAQTLGSGRKSIIFAPTAAINRSAVLFAGFSLAGGAFSDSNHTTRQSVAFGAAIRIGVSGVTKDESDKDEQTVELADLKFENKSPAYQAACASADYAVVQVTSGTSDAPVKFTYLLRNPKKPETILQRETVQLKQTPGSKASNPEQFGSEKNYWLFYFQPGELVLDLAPSTVSITEVGTNTPLDAQHIQLQKGHAYVVTVSEASRPSQQQNNGNLITPQTQTVL